MSIVAQLNPFDLFVDAAGTALDNGYIYIGEANKDPRQYPVQVYFDANLMIPAPSPLRTISGYVYRNGTPTFLFINGNYSVMVLDKSGRQVYFIPDVLLIGNGGAASLTDLANTADPSKGASLIPSAVRIVPNIAFLKTMPKAGGSVSVHVLDYYTLGGGGGGSYYLDAADITSVDNGGTVIVANDGGRWKLNRATAVTVKNFGAKGDGVTNDYPAFAAFLAWLQSGVGGVLSIPAGNFKLNNELVVYAMALNGWHNIIIQGAGSGTTVLDFSGAAAGQDGIAFAGYGGRFGIAGLTVKNAPQNGININKGEVRGGPSQISRYFIQDVIADNNGADGFRFLQTYMGYCRNIESRNNALRGIACLGFHTSLTFIRCWAGGDAPRPNGGNVGSGWFLNGLVYSSFVGCSGDFNNGPGWQVRNVSTVTLSDCGSESNGQEGILVQSQNTDTDGIPEVAKNISSFSIEGFFAFNNGRLAVNTYANFLAAVVSDARPIEITTSTCTDSNDLGSAMSYVLSGVSAPVFLYEKLNKIYGTTVTTGTVSRQNDTVIGRSAMAQLGGDQSVPSGVDTDVQLTTLIANRMIATIVGNVINIPKGVNRIKVTAGVFWNNNSSGTRAVRFTKNGAGAVGLAQAKVPASGFTSQCLVSAIIEVQQNDKIGMVVTQDSGGPLLLLNSGGTFLSVEAFG